MDYEKLCSKSYTYRKFLPTISASPPIMPIQRCREGAAHPELKPLAAGLAAECCTCRLLAQSRHPDRVGECPLSGVKRTSKFKSVTSAFDPNVWTRRALQEKTVRLGCTVLHQCIRPRIGAHAPDHHGNPRASDLISGHASKGSSGHQSSGALERPFLHLFFFSRRPRGQRFVALTSRFSLS